MLKIQNAMRKKLPIKIQKNLWKLKKNTKIDNLVKNNKNFKNRKSG